VTQTETVKSPALENPIFEAVNAHWLAPGAKAAPSFVVP
jgi:hypothetical protein